MISVLSTSSLHVHAQEVKKFLYTLLDLMRIDRSLVYYCYSEDRINTQVNYRLKVHNNTLLAGRTVVVLLFLPFDVI